LFDILRFRSSLPRWGYQGTKPLAWPPNYFARRKKLQYKDLWLSRTCPSTLAIQLCEATQFDEQQCRHSNRIGDWTNASATSL
jgi:hypothetical protein